MNEQERAQAREKIKQMPGFEVHWACLRLLHCLKILIINTEKRYSFSYSPPSFDYYMMANIRNRVQKNELDSETVRLIHNFLASVKTLVDKSRRVSERFRNSTQQKEYPQEVEAKVLSDPSEVVPMM